MQTDLYELQGEVIALRCFLAALITSLPLGVQLRAWPAFDHHIDLVRNGLSGSHAVGFDRAAISLAARRQTSSGALDIAPTP